MSIIQKVAIGALAVIVLGVSSYFISDYLSDSRQKKIDSPENIVADYKDLLAEAERFQMFIGADCDNKEDINKKIQEMENNLADLSERKKNWLDNVPELPNIDGESVEYIPEMLELNPSRPGTEIPELTSNVPELLDIDKINVIDPNEPIFQMEEIERKIKNILEALKALCQEETKEPAKKVISDKCSDACQRHKHCASYTEDVTPADLNDAYATCMEECPTWSKKIIKCINATDIKTPNDCVSFVQCQLPQFYEGKYLQ